MNCPDCKSTKVQELHRNRVDAEGIENGKPYNMILRVRMQCDVCSWVWFHAQYLNVKKRRADR